LPIADCPLPISGRPADFHACAQAAMANCVFRPAASWPRVSGTCSARRKSFTSAEMLVGKVDASKMLVRAMPDSPASRRRHTPSMA